MHIKEIILDGFKSYRDKTTITGFDSHFNAITGFNGSGKSNIFDALCFLLGITSLSNVRASNLTDLIYKKGNAGINKASVTIIFDNTDKSSSPIAYEDYDEIIVSRTIYQGKSKYYLNGYSATSDSIKSLFLSVQLNINNPHFLIMQGKVRQVVHMKPIEILGLLEEAAGTGIYQIRKESSLKIMKKKENKLEEISKILNEEISPQLSQLMKDKENYITWKSKEDQINIMKKKLTALDYYTHDRNINEKSNELLQYKSQRDNIQGDLNTILLKIEKIENELKLMEEKHKDKLDNNIKDMEKKVNDLKTELNTKVKKLEMLEKNYKNGQKDIEKNINDNENKKIIIYNYEKSKKDFISNKEMFETEINNKKEFLKELEINLDNIKNGKEDNISMLNLNKLIADCENNKKKSNLEKVSLINNIQFLSDENKSKKLKLNDIENKLKNSEKNYKILNKQINEYNNKLENYIKDNNEQEINNPEKIEKIKKNILNIQNELNQYERAQNDLLGRYASRLEIHFRDPEPNFDRNKVKGRVIRNISLKNSKYARAIEQVAGNKLYNIIVDNETTASLLLNRKCFDYGVTLIPLNKINPKIMDNNKKNYIENQFNGEAKLALDLINYDPNYKKAMEFVFGNCFVCNTSEIARKIAYNQNKNYNTKCVNLDGDEFDPSGLMKGGSSNANESILKKVDDLSSIQNKIKEKKEKVENEKNVLIELNEKNKMYYEIKNKLDELKNEIKEYDKDIILKDKDIISNEIKKNDEEIKRTEIRIEELNEFENKFENDLQKYKKEKKEFENVDSSKKEENYIKKIQDTKKAIKEYQNNLDVMKKKVNDIDYKISLLNAEIKDKEDDIKKEKENYENSKNEIEELKNKVEKLKIEFQKQDAILYEKKSEFQKNLNELEEIREEREKEINQKDSYNQDIKILDSKIEKYEKEIEDSKNIIKKLEKENEWILTEKDFFGIKETNYDFSKIDAKNLLKNLTKYQEENEILKRKVNMKVEVMADQYEKEYKSLIEKKQILLENKTQIQKAIDELDEKRKIAIEEIFSSVNKNLNKIYSSLLPNTKAKLVPVIENDLMSGLQLRVAFNNQWKKSLSELSGGQCSLLALSLILALLMYKPAPIYIFDEIDAALDLSHTANLGSMLREHFPKSQFIVVSLKDGMFNNANVLYKVSYVDGSSRVERITKTTL